MKMANVIITKKGGTTRSNGFADWTLEDVLKHNERIAKTKKKKEPAKTKTTKKKKVKTGKYKAQKTVVDGIKFDSKKEANRYIELKKLLKAGKIKNLRYQVPFELQPKFKIGSKTILPIKYIADFVYIDENGIEIVEDVKSPATITQAYKIKRKLFAYVYGKEIQEYI